MFRSVHNRLTSKDAFLLLVILLVVSGMVDRLHRILYGQDKDNPSILEQAHYNMGCLMILFLLYNTVNQFGASIFFQPLQAIQNRITRSRNNEAKKKLIAFEQKLSNNLRLFGLENAKKENNIINPLSSITDLRPSQLLLALKVRMLLKIDLNDYPLSELRVRGLCAYLTLLSSYINDSALYSARINNDNALDNQQQSRHTNYNELYEYLMSGTMHHMLDQTNQQLAMIDQHYTKGACIGLFQSRLPNEIGAQIGTYLDRKDAAKIVQVCESARTQACNESIRYLEK